MCFSKHDKHIFENIFLTQKGTLKPLNNETF